jgi:hypothetical protein
MLNKFMAAAGIIVLVFGLVMIALPVARIPLLDANRTILAESAKESYCAGVTYMKTAGAGQKDIAAECREESSKTDKIDYTVVVDEFCRGAIAGGLRMLQKDCTSIVYDRTFWPTMDGAITNEWNRKFPYPGNLLVVDNESSGRTGDRTGPEREGLTR